MRKTYCDFCGAEIIQGQNSVHWPAKIRIMVISTERGDFCFPGSLWAPYREEGKGDLCAVCLPKVLVTHPLVDCQPQRKQPQSGKARKAGRNRGGLNLSGLAASSRKAATKGGKQA
jgi:hypothetical protein